MSVKYLNEPCFMNKDGDVVPYLPKEIITHRDAYAASLHILLEHTAKFHVLVAEIIAEKYNLDVTEMMKTVREDDRFQLSVSDPALNALGYFDEKDLEKKVLVKPEGESVKPEGEPVKPEGEPVKPEGEVKPKKKFIRAKKAPEEAVAEAPFMPDISPANRAKIHKRATMKAAAAAAPAAAAAASFALPTSQVQLPNTRAGYEALAKQINDNGGINGSNIRVNAGSSLENIRKNFIRCLGLAAPAAALRTPPRASSPVSSICTTRATCG